MTVPAGVRLSAQLLNSVLGMSASDSQNTIATTIQTIYNETLLTSNTPAATTFVAPQSGIVFVINRAYVDHQTSTTARSYISFVIRQGAVIGSGTVFLAAADANAVEHVGQNDLTAATAVRVTGLTPGVTYNIRQSARTTSGTAEFQNRFIGIIPVAA